MHKYTLTFINNSSMSGTACVYQSLGGDVPDLKPIAWLTYDCTPETEVDLTWYIDYCFVWSKTGVLKHGVMFGSSQKMEASLDKNNKITLTNTEHGLTFINQRDGISGEMCIEQDGTIPMNTASIGIGMAGNCIYALQAQPNLNVSFTPPHPTELLHYFW